MADTDKLDVGFIGLGAMGAPMAANLVKAGHRVVVWNRSQGRAEPLVAAGARLAANPREAAACGMVVTILADDPAVEAVVHGDDGLFAGLTRGGLHVSMSTISLALSERLAAGHRERGQAYVSAPVFGRPPAAAAAQLFITAAGPAEQIARAQPLFDAMGQRTFSVGDTAPAANALKLAGNFMIMSAIEGLAQAMTLASKAGVEPAQFLEVMTETIFGAPVYRNYGAIVLQQAYRPAAFPAPLGLKDMRLLGEAAESLQTPMPFLGVIRDHLLQILAAEGEDIDWSAAALAVQRNAGL